MATYQEQIAKQQESKALKAMVCIAELADIERALAILERDGVLKPGEKRLFLIAFVHKHPEMAEQLDKHSSAAEERQKEEK